MDKLSLWKKYGVAFLFFSSSSFLSAEAPSAPPNGQGMWQTVIMLGIAFLFFYLILWRPEQKRKKLLDQQRSQLKKGDRVTAMGIIGTVVRMDEHTVILKMVDGSKIEFIKAAISDIMPSEGKKEEEAS